MSILFIGGAKMSGPFVEQIPLDEAVRRAFQGECDHGPVVYSAKFDNPAEDGAAARSA